MLKYTIKRLLQLIPILFAASILIFALVRISPSDPIASMTKGKKISAETRQALEKKYYLDKSYPEHYVIWINHAIRGDLGASFQHKQSVHSLIAERIPTTLQLVFMSAVLAIIIAIPVGVISAVRMNKLADRILSIATLILVASPVFLTAIVLMIVFALRLKMFPIFGAGEGFIQNLYYLFFTVTGIESEYGCADFAYYAKQYD
ncbi:MAG: ABC transporter permease [Eubacterium sp.]